MTFPGVNPDWKKLVLDSWPAVAASDLLLDSGLTWATEGLKAPRDSEALALAAMSRVVRHGASIALHMPLDQDILLPKAAFYLHRLRFDACQGLMRSGWFNKANLLGRPDLLVFGRSRRLLRDLVTSRVMHPQVVDLHKSLVGATEGQANMQKTLLLNGQSDMGLVLEWIESNSRPFAILVDATAQGCADQAASWNEVLAAFFPGVPVVTLAHTGQMFMKPLEVHTWHHRLLDRVGLTNRPLPQSARQIDVVAASDPHMDGFLKRIGFLVWNLKRTMEETGGLRSNEMTALWALDRIVRGLNVPLAVHESSIQRFVRGGRFAVRTAERWLEVASKLKGGRGDIQALVDESLALIRNGLEQLKDATPGRCELLMDLAQRAIAERHKLVILTGNSKDALILQGWIEQELGADVMELIQVLFMDGATAGVPAPVDVVVYAATLFPSRLHWLGMAAKRKVVLCHPFEHNRVALQIDRWWRSFALSSASTGDKAKLWRLDLPTSGYLKDVIVEDGAGAEQFVSYEECDRAGRYTKPLRVVELQPTRHFDDWLDMLMVESTLAEQVAQDVVESEEVSEANGQYTVIVHLDGHFEPLRWISNRKVMVWRNDELEVALAADLQPGDEVILLGISENRMATQRELFDMFVDNNHGLRQVLNISEKWQDLVDKGVNKLGTVAEVTRHLKSKRYSITAGAVQHWYAGRVMGPKDPASIRILAELVEMPKADQMADMINKAIQAIRSEHRKIGVDLRKAITMTRGRDVSGIQIGSRFFDQNIFDAMVEKAKINRIERPGQVGREVPRKSLTTIANEFAREYPSFLLFMPACYRSMLKSSYEDLDAFRKILGVLVGGFYPMYKNKTVSLKQVEDMLAPIPSSYAGDMSDMAKGKFSDAYARIYEGHRVDISKHIRLGTSFDQRYTLRLHFHWDPLRELIVVHHAGQHMPTLAS